MECLGKVAHLDSKNRAIVIVKNKVPKNTKIYDSENNLVGRAEVVFVSFDTEIGSFLKFWTWFPALRKDRFLVSLRPKTDSKIIFDD